MTLFDYLTMFGHELCSEIELPKKRRGWPKGKLRGPKMANKCKGDKKKGKGK